MSEVVQILCAIEQGDPHAAARLLPLVYDELRKLAARRLAQEAPGQTLQAIALVHEAYLRLVDGAHPSHRNSRGHFFAAAAEPCAAFWSRPHDGKGAKSTVETGSASNWTPPRPPPRTRATTSSPSTPLSPV
jgi:hypothetical protein